MTSLLNPHTSLSHKASVRWSPVNAHFVPCVITLPGTQCQTRLGSDCDGESEISVR